MGTSLLINMSAVHSAPVKTISTLHSLPCRISADNETGTIAAKVTTYFDSNTIVSGDGTAMTASLRGRPLRGARLNLPESYRGVVMRETEGLAGERTIKSEFSSICYWNLDATPTEGDKYPQCVQWIQVADTIHQLIPPPHS